MLPRLRAEEQLSALNAAAYPHMDKEARRSYARGLEGATGAAVEPVKPTRADLASIGIQVQEGNDG